MFRRRINWTTMSNRSVWQIRRTVVACVRADSCIHWLSCKRSRMIPDGTAFRQQCDRSRRPVSLFASHWSLILTSSNYSCTISSRTNSGDRPHDEQNFKKQYKTKSYIYHETLNWTEEHKTVHWVTEPFRWQHSLGLLYEKPTTGRYVWIYPCWSRNGCPTDIS